MLPQVRSPHRHHLVAPQIKCGDRPVRLVMFPVTAFLSRRTFSSTTATGRLHRTMSRYTASCEAGFASNPIIRFCCRAHAIPCHPTNAGGILKWTGTPRLQIVRHVVLQHGLKFSRPSDRKKRWRCWRRTTRPLLQNIARDLARCDALQHHVSSFRRFSTCFAPISCRTHIRKIGCKIEHLR